MLKFIRCWGSDLVRSAVAGYKYFHKPLSSNAMRSLDNRVNGRQCQTCGRTSPEWCNYFDWYPIAPDDPRPKGSNCDWDQMVKGPVWIERAKAKFGGIAPGW